MPNLQNLKPFTSEYQPANRGRKKGSLNNATVTRKGEAKVDFVNPITGEREKLTVEVMVSARVVPKPKE